MSFKQRNESRTKLHRHLPGEFHLAAHTFNTGDFELYRPNLQFCDKTRDISDRGLPSPLPDHNQSRANL
jgi:hypothetical protein